MESVIVKSIGNLNLRYVAIIFGLFVLGANRPSIAKQPNVVLVIADDQSWFDAGCYGSQVVKTPNIDKLAREGMRFDRAFTATAMCAPTRQQLYTGLFPVRNGAFPNHSKVKDGTKSLVHYFQEAGYSVGLCGKKHFGPAESFPFEPVPNEQLNEFVNQKAPFFLVYASNSPHLPWTDGDPSAYNPKTFVLPPHLHDNKETRAALRNYYAEITDFDRELGELDQLVESAGK
ncbi:MAG TPA: sulfatase atsG, partial [Planctomycetaceae bacterium]|nr:sulfatase atsG [Planctomycetaceae bacterium]